MKCLLLLYNTVYLYVNSTCIEYISQYLSYFYVSEFYVNSQALLLVNYIYIISKSTQAVDFLSH